MSEVNNSLTMDESIERGLLDRGKQGHIGKPIDRVDGPAKVTGQALYAYEAPVENVAYGYMLNAEIGRGRIASIDAEAARAAPGVIAVIIDAALVVTDEGGVFDSPVMPRNLPEIDHYGQPIGFIVAESFEAARAAAKLVRVDCEEEAGRYEMSDHLAEANPEPERALTPNQNVGDVDAGLAQAAVTLDVTYTTPHHLPAAMEPHATIARWEGDRLEIRSSLQMLKGAKGRIAASLDMEPANLRVLAPYIGGGFGGKTGVGAETIMAAIAAREVGRPVKVALTRRQTAHMSHRRSETRQRMRLGCDADGHILAIAQESFVSQKPSRTFVEPVSLGSHSLYAGANRRFTQSLVDLDILGTGPVRAPGEAVGTLALEAAMDEMAEKLGLDPIEFRKRNEPETDPINGRPYSVRRLVDCYDEGARRFGWERREPAPGQMRDGEWLIGLGMAAAFRKNLLSEGQARVRLTAEGRAVVETDMTDIGTGTYTIAAQVAGEMLGLPTDHVEVKLGDTAFPHGSGSGGSFGAAATGSSIGLACQEIVARLAERMDASPEELTLQDGMATARNHRVSIVELLGGEEISALGTIAQGTNGQTYNQASYGAHFAEAAVNSVTGEVRVRRLLGVFDCGRLLNLKTARSQAIGGMIWGLSYALQEEAILDKRTGAFVTRDLAEYHVPVNADVPQIEAHFIEEPDVHANPIGIKGIGELGNSGVGAAITNAIYNACGVRVRDFPLTLDKILDGLPPL